MSDDNQQDFKRGGGFNPLGPKPITLWRGEAEGIARTSHAQNPHDFHDGLYFTGERWLAEEYARLRSSPTNRPIVWRAEFSPSLLGPQEKILDLTSGNTGRAWEAYMNGTPQLRQLGLDLFPGLGEFLP